MIIINVLQVIINHVKVASMYESYYESYCSWNSISLHSSSSKMFHNLSINLVFFIFLPIFFLFLIFFLWVQWFFLHHLLHLQILPAQFWLHPHHLIIQLFGLHSFLSTINVFDFSCTCFHFLFWHCRFLVHSAFQQQLLVTISHL